MLDYYLTGNAFKTVQSRVDPTQLCDGHHNMAFYSTSCSEALAGLSLAISAAYPERQCTVQSYARILLPFRRHVNVSIGYAATFLRVSNDGVLPLSRSINLTPVPTGL
jgi:hypothetical protein